MNTLQSRYKLFHFNLSMSPLYLVKLKIVQNRRPFTTVRTVEQIVLNFRKRSFNVFLLFSCLLENSFSNLRTKNYILVGFYRNFIFKLNMVNFNM